MKKLLLLLFGIVLSIVAHAQIVEGKLHYQSGDTLILCDEKGYLYSLMHNDDGDALGVTQGGEYIGDVVIPEGVRYQGVTYLVTAVRRYAMMRDVDAPESKFLSGVTLPASVTIIGTDAFSGNTQLKSCYCKNPDVLIEARAFMNCIGMSEYQSSLPPIFAYTKPSQDKADRQFFIHPTSEKDGYYEAYTWAFFKNRHNGIKYLGFSNADDENAMECYCANLNRVRSANFQLRKPSQVNAMFSGYASPEQDVVILDNNYVSTHHFPSFSRWCYGEAEVNMSSEFVSQMQRNYGRKVRYSYQAAKVSDDGREQQVAVTEFEITRNEAMVVTSWVVDGDPVCSWVETQVVGSDYNPEEGSLWNVDDDGAYGIPSVLLIAQDDRGNVELFLRHSAPETNHYMHLKQKGNTLSLEHEQAVYILYE